MRVAYVTSYDGRNIRNYSGISFYIAHTLEQSGIEMDYVGPLANNYRWFLRAKSVFHRAILGKQHLREHDSLLLRDYARQAADRLSRLNVDWVLSPGTLPIAFLNCSQPIAFWSDATFSAMVDFYPAFSNLHRQTMADGMAMEQSALDRARLAIYSSDWAARSALRDYKVDAAKVKVVPYGANIECDRSLEDIKRLVDSRPVDRCNLLFLGVDWERKGGAMAYALACKLNEIGLPTELTVVGCEPPQSEMLPPFVRCLGFISKSTVEGRRRIDALLGQSHFLVVPSLADCTPIVFAESNSFGVPCLSTNVGGIPTLIRSGFNGRTFALTASIEEYTNYVKGLMARYSDYRQLALSSFNEFQTRLNWPVATESVKRLMEEAGN